MKLKTRLCDILGIDYPIIQAGMGWDELGSCTPPELVAAVSNAGGLGVIGGSPMQPELIRERIRQTRALTIECQQALDSAVFATKPWVIYDELPKWERLVPCHHRWKSYTDVGCFKLE